MDIKKITLEEADYISIVIDKNRVSIRRMKEDGFCTDTEFLAEKEVHNEPGQIEPIIVYKFKKNK